MNELQNEIANNYIRQCVPKIIKIKNSTEELYLINSDNNYIYINHKDVININYINLYIIT